MLGVDRQDTIFALMYYHLNCHMIGLTSAALVCLLDARDRLNPLTPSERDV